MDKINLDREFTPRSPEQAKRLSKGEVVLIERHEKSVDQHPGRVHFFFAKLLFRATIAGPDRPMSL